ncbi:MAG: translation initiation factor IF-3 [Patescibacteria group bacterium]
METLIQKPRINHQIRVPEVRVIGEDGSNLGVQPTANALELALASGLDLIEISPTAQPPVVRIMDRGKYQYQLDKEARQARKKSKEIEIRGIRVRLGTGLNDLILKAKKAEEFLSDGDRVQIQMTLRGREKGINKDFVHERLKKLLEAITVPFKVAEAPKKGPRGLLITIEPDHNGKNKQISTEKNQGDQNGQNHEAKPAPESL